MSTPSATSEATGTATFVTAWRITSRAYAGDAFSGEGARLYGGRFNSEGVPVVYLAGSLALAALEQLVHLSRAQLLAGQFVRFRVQILPQHIVDLAHDALPNDWPNRLTATRHVGDQWMADKRSVALRVPSAVVPEETNFLINPTHPAFDAALTIEEPAPFDFDGRLLR